MSQLKANKMNGSKHIRDTDMLSARNDKTLHEPIVHSNPNRPFVNHAPSFFGISQIEYCIRKTDFVRFKRHAPTSFIFVHKLQIKYSEVKIGRTRYKIDSNAAGMIQIS